MNATPRVRLAAHRLPPRKRLPAKKESRHQQSIFSYATMPPASSSLAEKILFASADIKLFTCPVKTCVIFFSSDWPNLVPLQRSAHWYILRAGDEPGYDRSGRPRCTAQRHLVGPFPSAEPHSLANLGGPECAHQQHRRTIHPLWFIAHHAFQYRHCAGENHQRRRVPCRGARGRQWRVAVDAILRLRSAEPQLDAKFFTDLDADEPAIFPGCRRDRVLL